MAKKIELENGRVWKTQSAALEHFKGMLARYEDNDTVDDLEDHEDLLALLERYDQLDLDEVSKVGCGIDYFERRLNRGEGYSSHGFWAIRSDGSETDFSYVSAVKGTPKSVAQQFYDACRNAVGRDLQAKMQTQFDRFSDEDGCLLCEFSGSRVTFSQAQLRHADPRFGVIVNNYRAQMGWSWDHIETLLTVSQDAQLSTNFLSAKDSKQFKDYHHSAAVLCIVAKDALRGLKRGAKLVVDNPITFK